MAGLSSHVPQLCVELRQPLRRTDVQPPPVVSLPAQPPGIQGAQQPGQQRKAPRRSAIKKLGPQQGHTGISQPLATFPADAPVPSQTEISFGVVPGVGYQRQVRQISWRNAQAAKSIS